MKRSATRGRPAALIVGLAAACVTCLWAAPGRARPVVVPLEVATGPTFFQLDVPRFGGERGPIAADQAWHFGWRVELAAVITRAWAKAHPELVSRRNRSRMKRIEQVHITPALLWLIPRTLIISPKIWNTGIYGLTWQFLNYGLGVPLGPLRLRVGVGAIFTYFFLHSDSVPAPFHFVRPGVDVGLSLFVPLSETVGLSVGWDSQLYIPQKVGGHVFEVGGEDPLWHIGQVHLKLHFQFPYTYRR